MTHFPRDLIGRVHMEEVGGSYGQTKLYPLAQLLFSRYFSLSGFGA